MCLCHRAVFLVETAVMLYDWEGNRIEVRYRKDPHMQNSMRKLKLTLTLTLTLTDTGGAVLTLMLGYRSL